LRDKLRNVSSHPAPTVASFLQYTNSRSDTGMASKAIMSFGNEIAMSGCGGIGAAEALTAWVTFIIETSVLDWGETNLYAVSCTAIRVSAIVVNFMTPIEMPT
jgi:hypothetical protein